MSEKILELTNVSKKYGNFEALKGIDLELSKSEVLGFIGPNGAGKTTTLRIILGLISSKGSVKVFGMDAWDDAVEIHKRLAYVPGDVNLWPNLTGGEVIDFFLRLKGQDKSPYKNELIEKFDLDPTKKCKTYSKGNRQKVALIAALAADVDLYIFDEPTSGLDPLMESIFQEEVRKIKERGKSVLLSSHILSEVEKLADSITLIKDGQIIEKGKLDDMNHLALSNVSLSSEDDLSQINSLPYIHDLKVDGNKVTFNIENKDLDLLIKEISKYKINSFETKIASLEEFFIGHYEKGDNNE